MSTTDSSATPRWASCSSSTQRSPLESGACCCSWHAREAKPGRAGLARDTSNCPPPAEPSSDHASSCRPAPRRTSARTRAYGVHRRAVRWSVLLIGTSDSHGVFSYGQSTSWSDPPDHIFDLTEALSSPERRYRAILTVLSAKKTRQWPEYEPVAVNSSWSALHRPHLVWNRPRSGIQAYFMPSGSTSTCTPVPMGVKSRHRRNRRRTAATGADSRRPWPSQRVQIRSRHYTSGFRRVTAANQPDIFDARAPIGR